MHEQRGAGDVARERRREEEARVADVARLADAAERDGGADRRDARLVAVVEVRLLGLRSCPRSTAFTRTFGAHSTASVCVSESSPALAAP